MDLYIELELIAILLGAFLGGVAASKLKQPLVVGYIISGLLLGSLMPFVKDSSGFITSLAEIGVALLLFSLGLEFSINRLKNVGKPAVIGSITQIILVCIIFSLVGTFIFNLPINVSVFIGIVISLSSTAIVAKILSDKGELDTSHGELAMAWLVVQDIAVVPIMLILPVLTLQQGFVLLDFGISVGKSLLAIYLIFILGRKTVPFIFKKLALYNSRELLLISAFLLFILVSAIAQYSGLGFAVGAFIAGVLLSTSAINHEVFTEIRPLRDVFASVFFVSLGFLINLGNILSVVWVAFLIVLFVLVVKITIVYFIAAYFNFHSKIAFLTSIALFQIGEFGFILAKIGFDRGILSQLLFEAVILASVITIVITPFLYDRSLKVYTGLKRISKNRSKFLYNYFFVKLDSDAKMPKPRNITLKEHVVIVGYGKVGKSVANVLTISKIPNVVIDIHYKTLITLRKRGSHSVYGDATSLDILTAAGVESAKSIIITTPDYITNELVLNHARKINPSIKVVVRAGTEQDIAKLTIKGVKDIVEPEFESAIQLSRKILKQYNFSGKDSRYIIEKVRKEQKY